MNNQRMRVENLSQERIDLLNQLGFVWKATKKTSVKKATKKAKEQLFHLRSQRTGLKQTSSLKKASRSRM